MIKVISIDPGRTTGYCYAQIIEGKPLEYFPFQAMDEVDDLWRRLAEFKPRYIIIEDFEFRQRARTGLVLFSVELIGVARLYSLVAPHQCSIFIQKASQGKGYYSDATLKAHNLHRRGVPHGMDASRHLLQWFTFGAGYQYNNGKPQFAKCLIDWGMKTQ